MQKWPAYGLDFYFGVRRYEVAETALELEPLLVVPSGVVFAFWVFWKELKRSQ